MRERRFACGAGSVEVGGLPVPFVDETGGTVELESSASKLVGGWVEVM